jgi:hypothetical protein
VNANVQTGQFLVATVPLLSRETTSRSLPPTFQLQTGIEQNKGNLQVAQVAAAQAHLLKGTGFTWRYQITVTRNETAFVK